MKIYKFKDLTDDKKHSHFLQIVLRNSIWCARPDSLNDEDEFKFKLDYKPSPRTAQLLSEVVAQYGSNNSLPPQANGVFVETNIPDHLVGQSYHGVHYVPDKIFHVDSLEWLDSEQAMARAARRDTGTHAGDSRHR